MKMNLKLLVISTLLILSSAMPQDIQGMQEPKNDTEIQKRWPHQHALELESQRANNDSELRKMIDFEFAQNEIPYEYVLSMISKLPLTAGGFFIEATLGSLRISIQTEKSEEDSHKEGTAKRIIDQYYKAYREDYFQRFPQEAQNSFDKAMEPFENYCKSFAAEDIDSMDEDVVNDKFEQAWSLLDKALKKQTTEK